MPAYRPPSYNAVHTRLLTAKWVDVEKKVEEKLGNSIGKYGITICCNGWDNIPNRPLLNVVQCGPSGENLVRERRAESGEQRVESGERKSKIF